MRKEQGFTLIEAIFAIAIFTILLQVLLQFFMTIYVDAKIFERKAYLEDNARAVRDFICEQVAESATVQIDCETGGKEITPIVVPEDNVEVLNETLKQICLDGEKQVTLDHNASSKKEVGEYALNYRGDGRTHNLVSDQIESLTVTRLKDSDYIEWTCVLGKRGESNPDLKETITFSTPIGHKAKWEAK